MALSDDVKKVLDDLAGHGWLSLFKAHGLNIKAADLAKELTKDISLSINRDLPGFKDFAREGKCAITPGLPAHSLLYHALASPHVVLDETGKKLGKFPTIAQIETIENYVYAAAKRSLSDVLRSVEGMHNYAVAVYALEYRTSKRTVHGKHADLCFSRTGVSRAGNAGPAYVPEARGFKSFISGDAANTIRVIPARYAAFIAVQLKGDLGSFGPSRFQASDNNIDFWVPVHKLFDGDECLGDASLIIEFGSEQTNEKLRRIHMGNMGRKRGFDSGYDEPVILAEPFIFHKGIAELSANADFGKCLLVPVTHAALVEEVMVNNKLLTTKVPDNRNDFSPTFNINPNGNFRPAPEYVHVRDKVENGALIHMNNAKDVMQNVDAGNYSAVHYIDFTGDGWVKANCRQIDHKIPRNIPAYSIVAACDFFPLVGQGELMDWYLNTVPGEIRKSIWRAEPESLSDDRIAPNINLRNVEFRPEDKSVTAIVSQVLPQGQAGRLSTSGEQSAETRNGALPDCAAGLFQPGWDTSRDITNGNEHLAGYGLGSPFPEDAKLCAAISTFWPAAAPDSSRQFSPGESANRSFVTVCPLTDEEVGIAPGSVPWDGNPGPLVINDHVEYTRFEYMDFTENVRLNKISLEKTSQVTFDEYTLRVLGMNRVYQALAKKAGVIEKRNWGIISFVIAGPADADIVAAANAGFSFTGPVLKFVMFKFKPAATQPQDFKKVRVGIDLKLTCLYNGLPEVLIDDKGWEKITVK